MISNVSSPNYLSLNLQLLSPSINLKILTLQYRLAKLPTPFLHSIPSYPTINTLPNSQPPLHSLYFILPYNLSHIKTNKSTSLHYHISLETKIPNTPIHESQSIPTSKPLNPSQQYLPTCSSPLSTCMSSTEKPWLVASCHILL